LCPDLLNHLRSPKTATKKQSKLGLQNEEGSTKFERTEDHIRDIGLIVDYSDFERLEETSKSIHKKGNGV
jgi:hypothetical protein